MERDTNLCLFNIAIAKAEARLFESLYKNRGSLSLQNQASLMSSPREILILHKLLLHQFPGFALHVSCTLKFTVNAV